MQQPNSIEIRTVEQSVRDALEYVNNAERILAELHGQVTGYGAEGNTEAVSSPGLVNDADRLASRLCGFVGDLERTRNRIVSPNVKSLGVQGAMGGMNSAAAYG